MKKNKTKKTGLIVAMMVITALFTVFSVQADENDVVFSKTVLDPESGLWVETIDADVGDTVKFNLTLEYNGLTSLYDIKILEELPESLRYVVGSAQFINHVNQIPSEEIVENKIYWNFTGVTQLVLDSVNNMMSIEFEATVQYGENAINNALINVTEAGYGIIEKYDTAEVNIMPYTFAKKIKNDDIWEDEATAIAGDIVYYKIAVRYYGIYNLTNISITDTLPDFLEFTGSKVEITQGDGEVNYSTDNKTFWVNFTDILNQSTGDRVEVLVTVYLNDTTTELYENIATVTMEHINETINFITAFENATLRILPNDPPNKPSKPTGFVVGPDGPGYGLVGQTLYFNTSAIDPNGDQVSYNFSWDDGAYSGWTDYNDSGEIVEAGHAWACPGIKEITVRAKDIRGAESVDSDHLLLQIFNEPPDIDIYPPSPPAKPSGNSTGQIGEELIYTTNTTDPDGSPVRYGWDWNGDNEVDEWTDFYPSGEDCSVSHNWSSGGTYRIKVRAKDNVGRISEWSEEKEVTITGDTPPTPGKPSGDSTVLVGEEHEYEATIPISAATNVYIKFVWGDGESTSWLGSYAPGETVNRSHSWDESGEYNVKVRISYYSDGSSYAESPALQVDVNTNESDITIEEIKGGLGVKATIKNTGDTEAEDVTWTLSIKGKRIFSLLDVSDEGTVNLSAGEDVVVKINERVFGFGRVEIKATAKNADEPTVSKTADGFIIGIIVIVLQ